MLFFEAGGVEVCGPFLVRERWALLSDLQPYRVCSQGGESHGRIQNVPVRACTRYSLIAARNSLSQSMCSCVRPTGCAFWSTNHSLLP